MFYVFLKDIGYIR